MTVGVGLAASAPAAAAAWWSLRARTTVRHGRGWRLTPATTGGAAGLSLVTTWWLVGAAHVVLVSVGIGVALGASRLVARTRAARRADQRSEAVLLACEGMAGDLAAGQPPLAALRRAAADWPELAPVAGAAELDADVASALRRLAGLPGAGQLRTVAAAWQVAHRSGAGLAGALAQTATMLRADRRTRRLVSTELAAARATARMMAALPALVLLLGVGIGGDPVSFLTRTPVGLGCLVAGLLLAYAGTAWLHRIADTVLGR